ncbi:flavin reductase family protein [Sphaerisporangium fuscum]|uniref:flavin reductase family protein n=1 Tax=Sphaerisporangium fuscum TaxID=2835868 RepID=UPI001BDBB99A|nr:flavin reductase family protein [Sphaerisporangium fuscum]
MSTHAARLIAPHGAAAVLGPAVHDGRPAPPPPLPAVPRTHPLNGHPVPAGDVRPVPAVDGSPAPRAVDPQHFRNVLGRFATGVVAITALDAAGRPCGLAANSFTSVSLDPPLVAFCVAHTSTSWPRLRSAARLCVNVLSEDHEQVCRQLASKGGDKFAGLAWDLSPGGSPVIEGAIAWIDCSVEAEHPAGDHLIVVARVHDLDGHADHGPLVFFRGSYGRFDG